MKKEIRKYLKKKLCRHNTFLRFRYSCKTCKNRKVCRKSHLYSWESEIKNMANFVVAGGMDEEDKRVMFLMGG